MYMCDGFVEEGGRWRMDERIVQVLLFSMRKKMNPFLWLLAPMEGWIPDVCGTVSGVCGLSIESGGISSS